MTDVNGKTILKSRSGRLFQVDADKAEEYRNNNNMSDASQSEVDDMIAQQQDYADYGSTGQQALGLAETAVRTGTFGLVDGIEGWQGRDKVLREESPILQFGAQALGTIAPALATGGAATAAGTALGLGGRTLTGLSLAAEGLAGGGADEIEQARAENRPISAANIIVGGIGGEIIGRAVPYATRRALSLGREAVSGIDNAIAREADNGLVNRVRVMDSRLVDDAVSFPPGPERDAHLSKTSKEQYSRLGRDVAPTIQAADAAIDDVFENTANIRKAADRHVPEYNAVHESNLNRNIADIKGSLRDIDSIQGPGTNVARNKATGVIKELLSDSQSALEKRSSTDAFLTNVRSYNKISKLSQELAENPKMWDNVIDNSVKDKLQEIVRSRKEALFSDLSDKSQYLGAADIFSDLNTLRVGYQSVRSELNQAVGGDLGKLSAGRAKQFFEGNADKSILNRLADTIDQAHDLHKTYGVGEKSYFDGANRSASELRKSGALADELQHVRSQNLKSEDPTQSGDGIGAFIRDTAIDAGLGLVGGPAAIGIRKGIQLVRKLGSAYNAARSIDSGVAGSIKAAGYNFVRPYIPMLKTGLNVAEKIAPYTRHTSPMARSALTRFQGDYSDPEASYEAKRTAISAIDSNPQVLHQSMVDSLGDLFRDDPKLSSEIIGRFTQNLNYIKDNLPPSVAVSILYPSGLPQSRSTIRDFAVLWNSVMEPMSVIEDFESRNASPAQMKYFRDTSPEAYQSLQESVITASANNYSQIPTQAKKQMDILFQTDGMAGPAFSSKAGEYVAQAIDANKQQLSVGSSNQKVPSPAPRGTNNLAQSVSNYRG